MSRRFSTRVGPLIYSTIRVWETQTWGCEKLLRDHAGPVYALTVLEGKMVSDFPGFRYEVGIVGERVHDGRVVGLFRLVSGLA